MSDFSYREDTILTEKMDQQGGGNVMKKVVSFFIFVSLIVVVPGIAMSVTQVVDFESRTTCLTVEA